MPSLLRCGDDESPPAPQREHLIAPGLVEGRLKDSVGWLGGGIADSLGMMGGLPRR
jgi:hypothetical protein